MWWSVFILSTPTHTHTQKDRTLVQLFWKVPVKDQILKFSDAIDHHKHMITGDKGVFIVLYEG